MILKNKHCKPCEKKTPPLTHEKAEEFREEVDNWTLDGDKKLEKTLVFKDFQAALDFVNKVGKIAESEGHHPDISIFSYNKVKLVLYTHKIDGLSENDFILASKIDELNRAKS